MITNKRMEYIYWDFSSKIFNCLKIGLHDVLFPCPVIILIALFCSMKRIWGMTPEYNTIGLNRMKQWTVKQYKWRGRHYGLTVQSVTQTLVSLFIILSICMFQDNVLSISKPRNSVWGISIISLEFTWTLLAIDVEFLVVNYIQWVFWRFIESKFDVNQLFIICKTVLSFESSSSGFLSITNTLD